jgi:hypothetical protein
MAVPRWCSPSSTTPFPIKPWRETLSWREIVPGGMPPTQHFLRGQDSFPMRCPGLFWRSLSFSRRANKGGLRHPSAMLLIPSLSAQAPTEHFLPGLARPFLQNSTPFSFSSRITSCMYFVLINFDSFSCT